MRLRTQKEYVDEAYNILTSVVLDYAPEDDKYVEMIRCLNRVIDTIQSFPSDENKAQWNFLRNEHIIKDFGDTGYTDEVFSFEMPEEAFAIGINFVDNVSMVDENGKVIREIPFHSPSDTEEHSRRYGEGTKLWCARYGNILSMNRPFHPWEDKLQLKLPYIEYLPHFDYDAPDELWGYNSYPEELWRLITIGAADEKSLGDFVNEYKGDKRFSRDFYSCLTGLWNMDHRYTEPEIAITKHGWNLFEKGLIR